jgi:hypothetical protein
MSHAFSAVLLIVSLAFLGCRRSDEDDGRARPANVTNAAADTSAPAAATTASPATGADAALASAAALDEDANPTGDTAGAVVEDAEDAGGDEEVEPAPLEALAPLPVGTTALRERLVSEIGAGLPVAILPTAIGVAAMSSDGVRGALLSTGEVRWALVDDAAQVI